LRAFGARTGQEAYPTLIPLLLVFLNVLGYSYQFPRDHFSHPEFKTEWWYYTGNVHTAAGHRYGFELVFFRQGQQRDPTNPSAWRIDDIYLAHLALTDIDSPAFRFYDRVNRAGPGIAGVSFEDARIWNGNWQASWNLDTGAQTLTAIESGIRLTLHLSPQTAPIIHGQNGISLKSETPGHESHYVSFPLLTLEGSLNDAAVTGTAWMDHEWFTNILEESAQGWDWFSVQLDNHSQLMLFEMRYRDSARKPFVSGTFIDPAGRSFALKGSEIAMQPTDWWRSSRTGARYPIRWRIAIPSRGIALECGAAIPNQELAFSSAPVYWEGAVRYSGSNSGVGYMELTGYRAPVRIQ
jgi:predicted secreted hydrolase